MIPYYIDAYRQKVKNELVRSNNLAWLTGMYVKEAIDSSFSKSHQYPSKPKDLPNNDPATDNKKELSTEQVEALQLKAFNSHLRMLKGMTGK